MRNTTYRCVLAVVTGLLVQGLVGCFPSRSEVYSELRHSRRGSYTRWRRQVDGDEALPRMEGDLAVEDAIKIALAYNPALRAVLEEKEKARGQVLQAYGEALPTFDLSADYTRLDEIPTVDLGVASFPIGAKNNWSYQVSLTQPLFKGGSIPAAIRGAQFMRFLSDETVRLTVQDVMLRVVGGYYDVLLAERLYEVQEDALEFAEANLKDVIAREEAGVAIPFDRLRAKVEVSNVQADLIQQRSSLDRARTALFRAMGVSQKSQVDLTDELTYLPTEPSSEVAVRTAFMNRPELYRGELDVRLQEEALRVFRSKYWPTLEAWGWFRWAKPDPHEATNIEWDRQWMAGLRLKWELFDGLRREGQIVQQKAKLRQSAIQLSDTEQAILEEIGNAIHDLNNAKELVQTQELNRERAREALRLVTLGAREGVNTGLEVLDARSALTRARGLYYQALYAHATARLALQRAMGILGPAPGADKVPERGPKPGVIEAFVRPQDAGTEGAEPAPAAGSESR